MVLLTPKFVFVAALASLTAFSLAPTADAAAIAVRRNHQNNPSDSPGSWSGSSLNHVNHPTIPLPARLTSASGKQTQDSKGESQRGGFKRQSPRDFFASRRRSLTPEDLPPLLTRRDSPHHKPQHSHEHGPPRTAGQQEELGTGPYVHIDGVNSHVAYDRRSPVPDPRHHHHHHHGNHHDDHSHGSKHTDDVVVIKGDNDNVHIGSRSPLPDPRHSHHQHQERHDRRYRVENNRRSPGPRHDDHRHHHHHHDDHHGHGHHKGHDGGDKVIIKGDDNNVSVDSRSRIARNQHHDHSPEHVEVASHEGHQHNVHARKYIPRRRSHHGGSSAEHVEHAHHSDQDRTERHPRSVLINSVEGEEKYVVPDDHRDQRVTVIEGDGISKVLTKVKRGEFGIEGVPGSVEIMSQSTKSEDGQRIASLVLVHPDSTMAEFGNNTFVLNASEGNSTQLYLVALNTTDSGVEGEDVPVALKVPVFNPATASMEGYCATYDPQPPAPAPLFAEPCFFDEPAGPHKSQVFAYTPSTSVIRPMWFSDEDDETDAVGDPSSNSTAQADGTVDPETPLSGNTASITKVGEFGNSTAPPSSITAFDNSTGIEEGPTGSGSGSGNESVIPGAEDFAAKAQNVTLIFRPATPIIPSGSTLTEDLADLDETPLGDSNSTDTDTSSVPLTSNTPGSFNDTETGWTGSSDDSGLASASIPLAHSVPSKTVSPFAVPSESGTPGEEGKDLNVVMVGVARDQTLGAQDSGMKAVSTAPYRWKFDRERS